MKKKIKIKRIIWTILLIIAILPFVITLFIGIDSAITGTHDGLCFMCTDRDLVYGFEAFGIIMIFAVYLFWPAYIVAAIVMIIAIIRLVMLKRKRSNKQ